MAIKITGTFEPGGDFGLLEDKNLIGGYVTVEDTTERDNIPQLKRKWGMLVYSKSDNKFYQLIDSGNGNLSDNSNWQEAQFGSNLTANNGIEINNDVIQLGGDLTKDTIINTQDKQLVIHHPDTNQPNADWSFRNGISSFQYVDPNNINKQLSAYLSKDYFALYVGSATNFYLQNPDAFYSNDRLSQRGEIVPLGFIDTRAGTIRAKLKAGTNQEIGSQSGPYTIDGVETQEGDIVFLAGQTDPKENGIYLYKDGGFERHPDFPNGIDISYYLVAVAEGDNNKNTVWQIRKPAIVGTDDILFDNVAGGSGSQSYTFTNGLTENTGTVKLGGDLTENTAIHLTTNYKLTFDEDGGNTNNFTIDFGNKTINAHIQGNSLFEGSGFRVTDTDSSIYANHDNGDNTSTQYYWKITKDKEVQSNTQTIKVKNDEYGITQFNLENANSSDNYAGASIVVTSSNTAYQDNTYISHLGPNFYVSAYQNSGLVYSDKTLWIGNPYSADETLNFVVGEQFDQPKIRTSLNKKFLHIHDNTRLKADYFTHTSIFDDITQIMSINATNNDGVAFAYDKQIPRKYVKTAQRKGSKYVEASQTLDFGFYFLKDQTKVRLYKNGTLLTYGTDWEWSQFPEMPTTSQRSLDYTTKVKLKGYSKNDTDDFVLEYDEYYLPEVFFDGRLLATKYDGTILDNVRPKMITKYININSNRYYLSNVTQVDAVTYDCEYTDENNFNNKHTIRKRFFNTFYLPAFEYDSSLDFDIEIWRENPAQSVNGKVNSYNKPPKQLSGHLVPAYRTNKNKVFFGNNTGSLRWRTNYFVRFRFLDEVGNTYYSPFMPYRIRKKHFNIFTISTGWGTTENYAGVYETLKIIY